MAYVYIFVILFATIADIESKAFPTGVRPLTKTQRETIRAWTKNSGQNIWELSGQIEGDMVFEVNQRNGMTSIWGPKWPNAVVPYEIDTTKFNSAQSAIIENAFQSVANVTCIKTRRRFLNETSYIFVTIENDGCWSYVGRTGSKQTLNLGTNCVTKSVIVHEFIHALGFFHMHSDTVRDDYVTIYLGNVMTGFESAFDKYARTHVTDYGEPYDYASIMHYSRKAFSKNNLDTIVPKDPTKVIGQQVISPIDIRKIKKRYDCPL